MQARAEADAVSFVEETGNDAPSASAAFGTAIAMQRFDIHIGAPFDGVGGRVHAFNRWDANINHSVSYAPEGLPPDARFGASIGVSGGNEGRDDAAIGAPGMRAVFAYDDVNYGPSAAPVRIDGPEGVENDAFGEQVARVEETIFVSARWADGAGRVHVYVEDGDTWEARDTYQGSGDEDSEFGDALIVSNDLLVIGAPGETVDGTAHAGAIYIYGREEYSQDRSWKFVERIPAPLAQEDLRFGDALALRGNRLAVGATGYVNGGDAWSGAAWTFVRDDAGVWAVESFLVDPTPAHKANFGRSLALGDNDLLVGSDGRRVERFLRTDSGFEHFVTIESPDGQHSAFGEALAIDGVNALVGAPQFAPAGDVFGTTLVRPLDVPEPGAGERLGWDVAVSGGVAVVASPFVDGPASRTGEVHVLTKNDEDLWDHTQALTRQGADAGDANEEFGFIA